MALSAIERAQSLEHSADELAWVLHLWIAHGHPHMDSFPWTFANAWHGVASDEPQATRLIEIAGSLAECGGACRGDIGYHGYRAAPDPVCAVLINGAEPAAEVVDALVERGGYAVASGDGGPLLTLASPTAERVRDQLLEAMGAGQHVVVPGVALRGRVLFELRVVAQFYRYRAVVVLPPGHDHGGDVTSEDWQVVEAHGRDDLRLAELI